jgi:hypothetical protein
VLGRSLGALFYEMTAGLPPFRAKSLKDLHRKILNEKISLPKWLSSDVSAPARPWLPCQVRATDEALAMRDACPSIPAGSLGAEGSAGAERAEAAGGGAVEPLRDRRRGGAQGTPLLQLRRLPRPSQDAGWVAGWGALPRASSGGVSEAQLSSPSYDSRDGGGLD